MFLHEVKTILTLICNRSLLLLKLPPNTFTLILVFPTCLCFSFAPPSPLSLVRFPHSLTYSLPPSQLPTFQLVLVFFKNIIHLSTIKQLFKKCIDSKFNHMYDTQYTYTHSQITNKNKFSEMLISHQKSIKKNLV